MINKKKVIGEISSPSPKDLKVVKTGGGFKEDQNNQDDKKSNTGNYIKIGLIAVTLIASVVVIKLIFSSSPTAAPATSPTNSNTTGKQGSTNAQTVNGKQTSTQQTTSGKTQVSNASPTDTVDTTMPDEKVASLTKDQLMDRVKAQSQDIISLQEQVKSLSGDPKFDKSSLTAPKVPPFKSTQVLTEKAYLDYVKYFEKNDKSAYTFWLDASYHGISYKIAIPYKVYKDLDPTGIILSDMESVVTDKGEKVITGFKIRDNVKDLMK